MKRKLVRGERLQVSKNEILTPDTYMFEENEPYPTATLTDAPEFAISTRDSYSYANESDLSATTFTSMTETHMLLP